jgi:hypothetical protein
MERKKASDLPQELLNLFDGYVYGGISRRQFWRVRSDLPRTFPAERWSTRDSDQDKGG